MTALIITGYSDNMLYADHARTFAENKYVYPVLSRRARGISVGINLTPDRVCNFNCVYCQVDRTNYIPHAKVDIKRISSELKETLESVISGRLFTIPPFDNTPVELRRLSDIALSGDAEPTTFTNFYEVVEEVIRVKQGEAAMNQRLINGHENPACHSVCHPELVSGSQTMPGQEIPKQVRDDNDRKAVFSGNIKLVLITNASCLNRLRVQDAIDLMYRYNGEVWAKLDAGSEDYFKEISRSHISLSDILRNIIMTARRHPVIIQSCFNRLAGALPSNDEIKLYCNRLKEIKNYGGMVRLVQLYTVARPPAEEYVTPLTEDELNLIAREVRKIVDLPTEVFAAT